MTDYPNGSKVIDMIVDRMDRIEAKLDQALASTNQTKGQQTVIIGLVSAAVSAVVSVAVSWLVPAGGL